MTRFLKTLFFFLLTLALFSSCKKTNAPTDGQLVAARIRALLGDPAGKQVYIYSVSTGQMLGAGPIAELGGDGQLILQAGSGETRVFNLETLISYTFDSNGNLTLYF
ncbi:hypothetical protein Q4E93_04750 [Flavitalea sp. BT771]|uniref:hypothetical protein n=1 Tax=Flavitalea sp. BT771 TaxID=3063329 RepID=UPI0026E48A1E|nr:hypothetical protein [Flavitalea sp. BT771]MDO6429878.1 hypothetical protein [Flavitalea sp. BT771]MDV6217994.1 hypothetical protein [Flavitalea sp. BT771]